MWEGWDMFFKFELGMGWYYGIVIDWVGFVFEEFIGIIFGEYM